MFGLFGKRKHYQRLEDAVWMTSAARQAGVVRQAQALATQGEAVALVCPSGNGFRACRDALGPDASKVRVLETFQLNAASVRPLARDGRLRVMVSELPAQLADEDRLLAALDVAEVKVQVQFHASLEDPALRPFLSDRLVGLLQTLGMTPDEPIVHAMVSRAIAGARRKAQAR